jgi:NAD(P)-dependent dehydrogenase (short-subunit alcohol dehydrogenase family)
LEEKKIAFFVCFSVFDLVRYAVPHIPKGGAIINVGSIQA